MIESFYGMKGENTQQEVFFSEIISPAISSTVVMDAFVAVDRADFVPESQLPFAYDDRIIQLEGATISQPSLSAKMIDMLQPSGFGKILEVGTASGYTAAVLARCSTYVHTVEILEDLADQARERLDRLGYPNITVHASDGIVGLEREGPFDSIIFAVSARFIPEPIQEQLKENGRIVIPIGKDDYEKSELILGEKRGGVIFTRPIGSVYFMPLMSSEDGGWTEEALEELEERKGVEYEKKINKLAKVLDKTPEDLRNGLREGAPNASEHDLNRMVVSRTERLFGPIDLEEE